MFQSPDQPPASWLTHRMPVRWMCLGLGLLDLVNAYMQLARDWKFRATFSGPGPSFLTALVGSVTIILLTWLVVGLVLTLGRTARSRVTIGQFCGVAAFGSTSAAVIIALAALFEVRTQRRALLDNLQTWLALAFLFASSWLLIKANPRRAAYGRTLSAVLIVICRWIAVGAWDQVL